MTILQPAATYLPPGVYIQTEPSPIVNVLGLAPTTVGLIGPSIGYRTFSDVLALHGTTAVALTQLGINPASVIVSSLGGVAYTLTTDYTLTVGAGADGNLGTLQDNTLTVQRTVGSSIPDGSEVVVSYQFTDVNYTAPFRANSFLDVSNYLGPPINPTTGAIQSPLCLAAMIVYQNSGGGGPVVVVPTASGTPPGQVPDVGTTTRADIQAGYNSLEAFPDVNIIVPVTPGIVGSNASPGDTLNLATDLANFITTDINANNIYRFGILGLDQNCTINHATVAAQARNKRTAVAFPNQLSFYNGFANATQTVDGFYLASAYAGLLAGQPVEDGITRETVQGFLDIPAALKNTMTQTFKNTLSQAGVAVAEMRRNNFLTTNNLVCRHGVTTDNSSINNREISLTRSEDALVVSMQATLDNAGFIGKPIGPNTLSSIKGVSTAVLETAKQNSIIFDYGTVLVQQDSVDPTVVNVKFTYIPEFPLNYIEVTISVNTQTGNVTNLTPTGNPGQ